MRLPVTSRLAPPSFGQTPIYTSLTRSNFYPPLHRSGLSHDVAVLPSRTATTGHCHTHFSRFLWAYSFWSPINESTTSVKFSLCFTQRQVPPAHLPCFTFGLLITIHSPCHVPTVPADNAQKVQGRTHCNYLNRVWTQQQQSELKDEKEENPSILLITTAAV